MAKHPLFLTQKLEELLSKKKIHEQAFFFNDERGQGALS